MLSAEEYDACDGEDLARLVGQGEISAEEVLASCLTAIEHLDPQINAVIATCEDQARAAVRAGLPQGSLRGVPMLLKDECQTLAGVPTSQGSRYPAAIGDIETELVRRYRAAGLVLAGKTNLPEFGASVTTEPVASGTTCNPWDPARTVGGSSGGSAAAVAAGLVPIAYANDGAGSIRIPASCTGTFGLKPSRGRTPSGPFVAEMWHGLVAEHVITRSVRDSAAALDATAGTDAGARYASPPTPGPYRRLVDATPPSLRIGVSRQRPGGGLVDPACSAAVGWAAELLEDLEHGVVEAEPPHAVGVLQESVAVLLSLELAAAIDAASARTELPASPDLVEPANWELAQRGRRLTALDLQRTLGELNHISRTSAAFWADHDVWLTPTLGSPPPLHGHITPLLDDADTYLERWFEFAPFTPLANVTGSPSASLPLTVSNGLPIGVCATAAPGREDLLLQLAGQLERARPWREVRAPLRTVGLDPFCAPA